MSEPAPERAPARSQGNVFTHKIGPLPMWIWVALIGGVLIAWSFYKSKTSAASTGSSTPASDVPQFVNQTYTTVQAPNVQDTDTDTDIDVKPKPPIVGNVAPCPRGHHRVNGKCVPIKPTGRHTGGAGGSDNDKNPPVFNSNYKVRPGDTLNSVAKRFGITRVELAHANGLGTGAGLRANQDLKVPNPAPQGEPNKAA